ncbi:MAG: hypothetical protein WB566_11535 [Terriglobales bacterium]
MKKTFLLVCLIALCTLTVLAQTGKELRSGHTDRAATRLAPKDGSSGLATIFSNLGPASDLYTDYYWFIDEIQDVGSAFTPAANAHVSQVQVSVQHFAGPKLIYVWIFSDSGGYPDTILEGPVAVTKIPEGGTCCDLAVADFLPLPVYAGQPYWVVVTTAMAGNETNFEGGWYWGNPGFPPPVSFDLGPHWSNRPTYQNAGVLVLGTWDPTSLGCD